MVIIIRLIMKNYGKFLGTLCFKLHMLCASIVPLFNNNDLSLYDISYLSIIHLQIYLANLKDFCIFM